MPRPLLHRHQSTDATFEIAQADSRKFWFDASKKLRATRFQVNQKIPFMLTPPFARQHTLGRNDVKGAPNRDEEVVVGHFELHSMQLDIFGRIFLEEHNARFDRFNLATTREAVSR